MNSGSRMFRYIQSKLLLWLNVRNACFLNKNTPSSFLLVDNIYASTYVINLLIFTYLKK